VIEFASHNGPITIEHFFEEISDLHLIIEHGPDWNTLTRCTLLSFLSAEGWKVGLDGAQPARESGRAQFCGR
jgi:hypothetical protein